MTDKIYSYIYLNVIIITPCFLYIGFITIGLDLEKNCNTGLVVTKTAQDCISIK